MTSFERWGMLISYLVVAAFSAAIYGGIVEARYETKIAESERKQAAANRQQQAKANAKTKAGLKRAQTTGDAQETGRAAVDQFFAGLAKESLHEATDPADRCVLPAARLRRWNAANAGPVYPAAEGGPAGQPDAGAFAPSGSAFWGRSRLGSQSPGGDQGVPLAGDTDVQPADFSGGQP